MDCRRHGRVLFTGAASFTGSFFARALADSGFEVVCTLQRKLHAYPETERRRLAGLEQDLVLVESCGSGSDRFLELCASPPGFGLFCMHGARSGNHRDGRFDALDAARANLAGIEPALAALRDGGLRAVLVTGSVFEADEGAGTEPRGAIGAYGLSKTLTFQTMRFLAAQSGIPLAKFVIPHPFGPLDKPGLVNSVIAAWNDGKTVQVRQPDLVRDTVPVTRLAAAYAGFAHDWSTGAARPVLRPSGFIEPTRGFVARLARHLQPILERPCAFDCADPPAATTEPRVRVNLDPLDALVPQWDEAAFWQALARQSGASNRN